MPQLRALQTFKGSREEGLVPRGETFVTSARRADVLTDKGLAKRVDKAERPDYTDKMQRPGYEDKRRWEGAGSWKTLYEGDEQVAKVQATKEEADAWAERDATLNDIQ